MFGLSVADLMVLVAPAPNLRPRIGEVKVEPAVPCSVFWQPKRPPLYDAVALRSPSPKGRPGGPRAERSDCITFYCLLSAPSMNTSAGVRLSSAL